MHLDRCAWRVRAACQVTPEQMPWTEEGTRDPCYGLVKQTDERERLRSRSRNVSETPFRNLADSMADPPHANVFGPLKSHADFGTVKSLGGLNKQWRESKVAMLSHTTAPWFGPPPRSTGKLRCAFVQHMGPNSVPRGAPHADMEGGRITHYAVDRPMTSIF